MKFQTHIRSQTHRVCSHSRYATVAVFNQAVIVLPGSLPHAEQMVELPRSRNPTASSRLACRSLSVQR
ncbi:hypothetical protein K438DRAFT_76392 [Mycena galopus ATCC 62051]|nr:hypothetical protein K438DRAFT_76392 [Mycena galopus ATCC 62051]